ncbi:hypothetical protein WKK05_08325 [Nostoc sp. UHCC 0302]|uniref:hypothetical protein n=1 Tax=Nostoc sp. UHCC 0302 TaxID=3134896 RepID=UPI00311CC557
MPLPESCGECNAHPYCAFGTALSAIAMSGEDVYTAEGEAVELQEMMRRYPMQE